MLTLKSRAFLLYVISGFPRLLLEGSLRNVQERPSRDNPRYSCHYFQCPSLILQSKSLSTAWMTIPEDGDNSYGTERQ